MSFLLAISEGCKGLWPLFGWQSTPYFGLGTIEESILGILNYCLLVAKCPSFDLSPCLRILYHVLGFFGHFRAKAKFTIYCPVENGQKLNSHHFAKFHQSAPKICIQSQIIYVVREDGKNCQKSYFKLVHMSVHGGLEMVNCYCSDMFRAVRAFLTFKVYVFAHIGCLKQCHGNKVSFKFP